MTSRWSTYPILLAFGLLLGGPTGALAASCGLFVGVGHQDGPGGYTSFPGFSVADCCDACAEDPACASFTRTDEDWIDGVQCYLYDTPSDGVTVHSDCVSGNALCPAAPEATCTGGFGKASLVSQEKAVGKEKLVAKFIKGPAIAEPDLGDPTVVDGTAFGLCLYDDAGTRVAWLDVDRAGEDCAPGKACWKGLGNPAGSKGFKYKDKDRVASGIQTALLKTGAADKSKLIVSAANNAAKGQASLPTGISSALAATTSVQMQLVGDNGACYEAVLADIKKQTPDLFKALQ